MLLVAAGPPDSVQRLNHIALGQALWFYIFFILTRPGHSRFTIVNQFWHPPRNTPAIRMSEMGLLRPIHSALVTTNVRYAPIVL
jgi:hypothetical protein